MWKPTLRLSVSFLMPLFIVPFWFAEVEAQGGGYDRCEICTTVGMCYSFILPGYHICLEQGGECWTGDDECSPNQVLNDVNPEGTIRWELLPDRGNARPIEVQGPDDLRVRYATLCSGAVVVAAYPRKEEKKIRDSLTRLVI